MRVTDLTLTVGALTAALVAAAGPALATCLNTDPQADTTRAATVTGADKRVFFVQDADQVAGCPSASDTCRAKAYVMPGDAVLISMQQGGYSCASFTNARGVTTTNWLPSAALALLPAKPPSLQDWPGSWVRIEAEIKIIPADRPGQLAITGNATWGAFDPERVRRGGVNIGEIAATVKPQAGHIAFATSGDATLPYDQGGQYDCRVRMSIIGPYLLVSDNDLCGGHNVTFSGIYHRDK